MKRMFSKKEVKELSIQASGKKLYRHHFDIVLNHDDLDDIPSGSIVTINVNALSLDEKPWETLSELDGGGYILSAFGTIVHPAVVTDYVFELKIYYKTLDVLLVNIHNLTDGSITAVALDSVDGGDTPSSWEIEDSVTSF